MTTDNIIDLSDLAERPVGRPVKLSDGITYNMATRDDLDAVMIAQVNKAMALLRVGEEVDEVEGLAQQEKGFRTIVRVALPTLPENRENELPFRHVITIASAFLEEFHEATGAMLQTIPDSLMQRLPTTPS